MFFFGVAPAAQCYTFYHEKRPVEDCGKDLKHHLESKRSPSMVKPDVFFRWLGAAGMELRCNGFSLLVDPYLSRISFIRFLLGGLDADDKKIFAVIDRANAILVTHSHFDHLMDVPLIAKRYGSAVYGSPNTRLLLTRCGVPAAQIREAAPGDDFVAGPFRVTALKSSHPFPWLFRPAGLPARMRPPRRALDYGMDSQFAYRITVGKNTLLTDPGRESGKDDVDVLFVNPLQGKKVCRMILESINPKLVVPLHWDNFFRRVSRSREAPSWGLLPVPRVLLKTLGGEVAGGASGGRFFLPRPFVHYRLDDIISAFY
jgi:L-ascorbate metabolism protein UlaG (beta-lactamase superfamily)